VLLTGWFGLVEDFGITVAITRGTRGIGAAIARHFVERRAKVALAARRDTRLASELGENACFVPFDVVQPSQIEEVV